MGIFCKIRLILRQNKGKIMNEEQDLAQLDAKIDEAIAYIKDLRQKNDALKLVINEKDQKISELQATIKSAEERVEALLKQLPPEKGE